MNLWKDGARLDFQGSIYATMKSLVILNVERILWSLRFKTFYCKPLEPDSFDQDSWQTWLFGWFLVDETLLVPGLVMIKNPWDVDTPVFSTGQ